MSTMAQLNVRMEPELKCAGEAVLDRMGITSTQMIRALWMKIARGAQALDQVIEVLAEEPAAMEVNMQQPEESLLSDPFDARLHEFYREAGLDPQTYAVPSEAEWEEFELEDWQDRECERLVYHAE